LPSKASELVVPSPTDRTVFTALREQHARLDDLLDDLRAEDWHLPTRCDGWTVADVVLHLAQSDELALASAQGRFTDELELLASGPDRQGNVDDGAAAMVARERGMSLDALARRWRTGAAQLRVALGERDPHQRVDWVAGRLSIRTLATTRLAECWIHTGDVCAALGRVQAETDDLEHVARLAWRTLPYAFARGGRNLQGPVAFDLRAPSGRRWNFVPEDEPATVIEGPGAELCLVAARRLDAASTSLRGTGPDARAVLELVRTYA
jgi:uncharacterized protein (TIGR03084 family)